MAGKISVAITTIKQSPVLMSWANLFIKSSSILILTPIVLVNLSSEESTLWLLFVTMITFQMLLDLGFSQTSSRVVAYGLAGVKVKDLTRAGSVLLAQGGGAEPNWRTIGLLYYKMKVWYRNLALVGLITASVLGTASVWPLISITQNPMFSSLAWLVLLLNFPLLLYGNIFSSVLIGLNEVALVQRVQMLFAFLGNTLAIVSVVFTSSLLLLIFVHQLALLATVVANYVILSRSKNVKIYKPSKCESELIWDCIWPATWRSGVGILMSAGFVQLTGIMYVQFASVKESASYLLGLQLIRAISSFSQAPFYSKIPGFVRLYASGEVGSLLSIAERAMRLSYFVFVFGVISASLFGDWLLAVVGANVDFPAQGIWWLLGLGVLFERFGAMHIQLYSLSNRIVWHVANGGAGVIAFGTVLIFYPIIGVCSFPISILVGNLSFYSWYSAMHSYKHFGLDFFSFERTLFIPALICFILFMCVEVFVVSTGPVMSF